MYWLDLRAGLSSRTGIAVNDWEFVKEQSLVRAKIIKKLIPLLHRFSLHIFSECGVKTTWAAIID